MHPQLNVIASYGYPSLKISPKSLSSYQYLSSIIKILLPFIKYFASIRIYAVRCLYYRPAKVARKL